MGGNQEKLPGRKLGIFFIVLITVAAYLPSMRGDFIWDDHDYVTRNVHLRTADGLRRTWLEPGATIQYYPLVFTTFWLEYHLWGLHPLGFHVVNVLLHALNAVLLWLILERLAVRGAWLAAAVFAIHPVHMESVAWIVERKNVLSGLFYLAALLLYFRFARFGLGENEGPRRWGYYAGALVLLCLAMFSKTVVFSLPAAIFLLLWWKKDRIRWRDVYPLLPMLAIAGVLGRITVSVENRIGAGHLPLDLSFLERCLLAGRALWFYAGKLFWPANLIFVYPRWAVDEKVWWQYLYPAAALSVIAALFLLRRRIGKGPLVAVLYFAGTLLPALGFFNFVYMILYSFVADHLQYLASIGLIALAVSLGVSALDALSKRAAAVKTLRTAVPVLLIAVLVGLCWSHGRIYKNEEVLWRDTFRRNPNAVMAKINLSIFYMSERRLEESRALLESAVRADPAVVHPTVLAKAHHNLAVNLGYLGHPAEAIREYRKALTIDPTSYSTYYMIALTYEAMDRLDEAIENYRTILNIQPNFPGARTGLERALRKKQALGPVVGR
jgi:Tfp pilus assembly protein PilF